MTPSRPMTMMLVEGKDEVLLLKRLLRDRFPEAVARVKVKEVGGSTRFRKKIQALRADSERRGSPLRALAIIRDADQSAESAWQSVTGAVEASGLEPPPKHGAFSEGRPAVGVFITPDGACQGALETLCRRSVADHPAAPCVEEYLACLEGAGALESSNRDKSFVHAFLSSRMDPVARVGESAQQKVWNFAHPAFDPLCHFVEALLQIE